jgi:exosortase F-associated protein
MSSLRKLFVLSLFLGLFILLRKFTSSFYEPLEFYFNSGAVVELPSNIKIGHYILSLGIRFLMNSLLSLACIYYFFKNREITSLAFKVFLFIGSFLFVFYFLMLAFDFPFGHRFAFYVRRIIIYPILLIVLLAGFEFLNPKIK